MEGEEKGALWQNLLPLAKIQILLFFLGMQLDYISPSPLHGPRTDNGM